MRQKHCQASRKGGGAVPRTCVQVEFRPAEVMSMQSGAAEDCRKFSLRKQSMFEEDGLEGKAKPLPQAGLCCISAMFIYVYIMKAFQ